MVAVVRLPEDPCRSSLLRVGTGGVHREKAGGLRFTVRGRIGRRGKRGREAYAGRPAGGRNRRAARQAAGSTWRVVTLWLLAQEVPAEFEAPTLKV